MPQEIVDTSIVDPALVADDNDLSFLNADESADIEPTPPEARPITPKKPAIAAQPVVADPENPTPAVTTPAAVHHPAVLLRQAKYLGIPQAEVAAMDTDELAHLVFETTRRTAMLEAQQLREPAKVEVATPAEKDQLTELDEIDADLQLDPRMKKLMQGLIKENLALKGTVDKTVEHIKTRETRNNAEIFDEAFEALGADYEHLFGKGSGLEMANDADEKARRITALQAAGINTAQDSPKTIQRKIAATVKRLWPTAPKPVAAEADPYADALSGKAGATSTPPAATNGNGKNRLTKEQWEAAALAKPTAAKKPKTKGDKAAEDAIKQFMEDRGITRDEEETIRGVPD